MGSVVSKSDYFVSFASAALLSMDTVSSAKSRAIFLLQMHSVIVIILRVGHTWSVWALCTEYILVHRAHDPSQSKLSRTRDGSDPFDMTPLRVGDPGAS